MSAYIENMRARRDVSAVTKTEFAIFASGVPQDHLILIFEGRDDKAAYAHWVRRVDPNLKYEAQVRYNKAAVLKLHDSLRDDVTGLARRTLYFVDRDFDDLQGREHTDSIFMTDCYSIENYCVTAEVFEDLLKDEFHCNGLNAERTQLVRQFEKVYNDFLSATKGINFRIYIARKLAISQDDKLPSRINQIATIELQGAKGIGIDLVNIVPLEREPTTAEVNALTQAFEELEPASRYRGKFALMFFIRWLELLRADRLKNHVGLFAAFGDTQFNVRGDFSFDALVPKVPPPLGLKAFLHRPVHGAWAQTAVD